MYITSTYTGIIYTSIYTCIYASVYTGIFTSVYIGTYKCERVWSLEGKDAGADQYLLWIFGCLKDRKKERGRERDWMENIYKK